MKSKPVFTSLILSIIIFTSCSKNDCTDVNLNEVFQFKQSDLICLPDGTQIEFKSIDDQRCPCFVECIWEGEFIFELVISKSGSQSTFLLHEKIENASPSNFNYSFQDMKLVSSDDCNDPTPIDKMIFEMQIVN